MTRRSFCHRLGLLGATALTAPSTSLVAETTSARIRFTLCLNPGAIGVRASQPEAIRLAARHGFRSVEPMAGALAALDTGALAEVRASLQANRLVWGSAGLPVDFRSDETRFAEGLKALPEVATSLQRAGVDRVNTWLSPGSRMLTYWNNFKLHQRRLGEIAKVLHDHGQRLGLEYVGTHTSLIRSRYPFIHTLAETRDLIAAIDTPQVGLVLDSWHWWQADDTAEDLLSLHNDDVVAVDLNDAPRNIAKREQKDGERELPAATGAIDVNTFLKCLVQIGYDGPIRAEPFNRTLNELDNDAACESTILALRRAVATVAEPA